MYGFCDSKDSEIYEVAPHVTEFNQEDESTTSADVQSACCWGRVFKYAAEGCLIGSEIVTMPICIYCFYSGDFIPGGIAAFLSLAPCLPMYELTKVNSENSLKDRVEAIESAHQTDIENKHASLETQILTMNSLISRIEVLNDSEITNDEKSEQLGVILGELKIVQDKFEEIRKLFQWHTRNLRKLESYVSHYTNSKRSLFQYLGFSRENADDLDDHSIDLERGRELFPEGYESSTKERIGLIQIHENLFYQIQILKDLVEKLLLEHSDLQQFSDEPPPLSRTDSNSSGLMIGVKVSHYNDPDEFSDFRVEVNEYGEEQ